MFRARLRASLLAPGTEVHRTADASRSSEMAPDATSLLSYSKQELVSMHCAPPAPPFRSEAPAAPLRPPPESQRKYLHLAALPLTPPNVVRGLSSASLVLDDLEALAGPTYGRKCAKSQRYTTCQVRCLTYLLSCTSPPLLTHARDRRGPSDGGHRLRVMLPSSSSSRTHQIALADRVEPFLTCTFFWE